MSPRRIPVMANATERVEKIMNMMRAMKNQLDVIEKDRRKGINPRLEEESDDEELRI